MTNKLKIGLIVDGPHVSQHVYELAEWANTTDCLNISDLIIQQLPVAANARDVTLSSLLRAGPNRGAREPGVAVSEQFHLSFPLELII
jgi:hypothetical protein